MNLSILPKDLPVPIDDGKCDHLLNSRIPNISLPNQDGNELKLNRNDTFRIILYCYPMTGSPNKKLPKNWDSIPGARGCTPQNCSIRNFNDDLLSLNAIPIGITTQTIEEIKEMTVRHKILHDILSDQNHKFIKILNLPTFQVEKNTYIKRITMIIENSIIKHVFYPVFPPDLHVKEIIK